MRGSRLKRNLSSLDEYCISYLSGRPEGQMIMLKLMPRLVPLTTLVYKIYSSSTQLLLIQDVLGEGRPLPSQINSR